MKLRWLHPLALTLIFCLLTSSMAAAARPAALAVAVSNEPADAFNWWIERAEAPLTFKNMNPHSLGLTSTGAPHVVYGGDHLYHAYKGRGGSWVSETVDPAWGVGSFASLAIDSADKFHIAYIDTAAGCLRYATNRYGSWQVETQFYGSVQGATNAVIAVDAGNDPHIVFAVPGGALKYTSYDSGYGAWLEPETLATGAGLLDYPGAFALAVGPLATPHVSYHKHVTDYNGSLYYTKRTGYASWSAPLALAVGGDSSGDYNDIALNGSIPHVAASAVSIISPGTYLNEVRYTFLDGAAWHSAEMVTFTAYNGAAAPPAAIVLRLVGAAPYLAYQDPGVGYYWQTRLADNNWSSEEAVVTGAAVGSWASFAMFGGYPYATWYSTSARTLSFCYKAAAVWQAPNTLAVNGHEVNSRSALAVDALGRSHIVYRDQTTLQPVYARFDGTGWTHLNVDTDPVVDYFGLALVNNFPRVLYYGKDGTVRYTNMMCLPGCAFLAPETVDIGLVSPLYGLSLAVHSVTGVQAAYVKNGSLIYARRIAADDWSKTTVETGVNGEVYLALDAGGAPHVMYRKSGSLYYAYKDTAWHTGDLIADGTLGFDPSFKISPQGAPVAAYTRYTSGSAADLVYAARSCFGNVCTWFPQTLAADADEAAALAFDSRGQPVIAYFTLSGMDLKIARRLAAPSTWVTQVIDSRGWVGFHSSIALSPRNGKLRIAYTDDTNADLKLALEGEQVFVPLVRK